MRIPELLTKAQDTSLKFFIEKIPRNLLEKAVKFTKRDEQSLQRDKQKLEHNPQFAAEVHETVRTAHLFHVVINYNQRELAKGQVELSQALWAPEVASYQPIYVTNADKAEEQKPLEKGETFIQRENLGHFAGATDLINTGVAEALRQSQHPDDVIVVASADVWQMDQAAWLINMWRFIKGTGQCMARAKGRGEITTELFMIKAELARQVFPLDYQSLVDTPKGQALLAGKRGYVEWLFWEKLKAVGGATDGKLQLYKGMRLALTPADTSDLVIPPTARFAPEYGYESSHDDNLRRANFQQLPEKTQQSIYELNAAGKIPSVADVLQI